MRHFLLDTSALLALRDDEPGAELKAGFSISVVDAWIAAASIHQGAVLVHKDPEFDTLAIEQERLPLKPRK